MGVTSQALAIGACLIALSACSDERTPLPATIKTVSVIGIRPPDEDTGLRLGLRDVRSRAGYSISPGHCKDWRNRVRIGQRFRLRFERWRTTKGLEFETPSRTDIHERLCGAVRNPGDRWMDGLPPTSYRRVGEFP